ncbi:hypothetical protein HYV43_06490 [Candidatus Micrarchaeota archaeon]|nr:hypothetical protein [Candidatus Micrarchaeota archaeon]
MDFEKKLVAFSLLALLLVPMAGAFAISSIETSASSSSVTTGTDVTVTSSVTADSSGSATQISLSGTGAGGSPLTVSDPSGGYYSTVSLSTSATSLSFVVSAAAADTYSYSVTGTYSGGSSSSTPATIVFINPDTLTTLGSVSNSTPRVGNSITVTVTVTNPSSTSSVTTAYNLDYNSSAFTLLSGDSSSGTVTLLASQSQTFTYTLNATAAVTSSPILFGLGDSSDAFSSTVTTTSTDTSAPVVTLSTPANAAALTSSSQSFTFSFADSDSTGTAACRLYIDSALSGTVQTVAEGATGTVSVTGLTAGSHSWLVNCYDAASNSGNSSARTFSVTLSTGSTGGGSTPTATAVPTSSASTSSPALPSAPTTTGTGQPVEETQTENVGTATTVRGSFASDSATLEVAYTAPASGFSGDLTYTLPLDFADYESGVVRISPEPTSVAPGSIVATWDVTLAPKETFIATVDVSKKLDSSVLKEFKSPKLAPRSSGVVATAAPTAAPSEAAAAKAPTPAGTDNTLLYIVGALVVLGLLYYFVGMRRK